MALQYQELVICVLGGMICLGSVVVGERLGGKLQQFSMLAIGVLLLGSGVYRL